MFYKKKFLKMSSEENENEIKENKKWSEFIQEINNKKQLEKISNNNERK